MRGVYFATIECTGLVVSTYATLGSGDQKTLMLIEVPSTIAVEVMDAWVQEVDSTYQQITCALWRVETLGDDVAGTAITPSSMEVHDASSLCTVYGALTGEPETYNIVVDQQAAPSNSGYLFAPPAAEHVYVPPSAYLGLVAVYVPTSGNFQVAMRWREIG